MPTSRIFSSAITRVGAPGNTALTSTDIVGVNQGFSLNTTPARADLFDTIQNSVRAVDNMDHSVKDTVKIDNKDLNYNIMALQTGGAVTTPTGRHRVTVTATNVAGYVRIEADLVDSNGKNWYFVATRAKAKGFSLDAKLTDFADIPLEFDLYPDPTATVANTVWYAEHVD